MENIYIMSGVRTAIGKYGGSLKSVPAHTMGALVIREALSRAGIAGALVDEVILGEVRQSTEASNIARCALLEAGLPETVPGYTVNRLCASAMQAVLCGYQEIWTGQAKTVVAGGTENMSRAPIYLRGSRWGGNKNTLVDSNIEAGTTSAPAEIYGTGLSMPKTAENVAECFHITREEQDAFSVESQRRAHQAIQAGYFKEEIVPVHVKEKKNEFIFDTDEFVKPTTTLEVLAKLRPIVKPDGTVTAGNSCGLNDGAAALVLMSETQVKAIGLKPMARIIDVTTAALDPTIMGYGPYYATNKILQRTGMTLDRDRPGGTERGLCLPVRGLYPGSGPGPRQGQHQRRRHRPGPSPGLHRSPADRHPDAQPEAHRRENRLGYPVHWRRTGHGRPD